MDARTLAKALGLEPHPEGGYYRETYRSPIEVTPPEWPRKRSLATAILYLLPTGSRSASHRVRGDELWMWHRGAPMLLTIGDREHLVGPDVEAGQQLHVLVPGGAWQSATPAPGGAWSLVACVVAPGFDFDDFELRHGLTR